MDSPIPGFIKKLQLTESECSILIEEITAQSEDVQMAWVAVLASADTETQQKICKVIATQKKRESGAISQEFMYSFLEDMISTTQREEKLKDSLN